MNFPQFPLVPFFLSLYNSINNTCNPVIENEIELIIFYLATHTPRIVLVSIHFLRFNITTVWSLLTEGSTGIRKQDCHQKLDHLAVADKCFRWSRKAAWSAASGRLQLLLLQYALHDRVYFDNQRELEYFALQKLGNMKSPSVIMTALLLLYHSPLHKCFNFMKVTSNGRFTTNLQLNRIFCDMEELTVSYIGPDLQQSLVLKINESDIRCKHIKSILKLKVGDTIKGTP
jgi:hypothetical protein